MFMLTLSGLLLTGLAAAIAPCPLATNLTALGYICRRIGNRRASLAAASLYTLGRIGAYVLLGWLAGVGLENAPSLSFRLQTELTQYLAPLMLLGGLLILGLLPLPRLGSGRMKSHLAERLGASGALGSLGLGFLFALALCPPSAALLFGSALPLSLEMGGGKLWLGMAAFGCGSALPVALIALLISFGSAKSRAVMKHLPSVQKAVNLLTGAAFLLLGAYWALDGLLPTWDPFALIEILANLFTAEVLAIPLETPIGASVSFFLFETLKVLLLLYLISLLMGIVNMYFPVERVRRFLTTRRLFGLQYLLAAVFGAVTPFCSCSSIPLFIGFLRGGIPLGVTFSFLITSPLVNEVAVAMFLSAFGLKITVIYTLTGILMGSIGGFILSRFPLHRLLTEWLLALQHDGESRLAAEGGPRPAFRERLAVVQREALGILRGVLPYVLIGIAIGAGAHGYVPDGFFTELMGPENLFALPAAVLCAIPMYANAAAIVPVIEVFVSKGVPIGTAIAFMMATVGLSLPEAMLLRKVMTWRLIGIFFGTVAVFILLFGYLFNLLFA